MRRLLIRVDVVQPDDRSATRFEPYFEATAQISARITDDLRGVGEDNVAAHNAIDKALAALSLRCAKSAPNGTMCHHPVSCTLAGSCLKQRGGGTACNE